MSRTGNQNGILCACGNPAICHRHASDRIYTDAGNNFHHLLHSDVLVQNKYGPRGQGEKAQPAQDAGEQKGLKLVFFLTQMTLACSAELRGC